MQELSDIISTQKEKRGYLKFANTEIDLIKDKTGTITNVEKKESGPAQELIENFMVMANTCIATHLGWIEFIPSIYRNHGKPNFDKVNMTLDFISSLGYRFRTVNNTNNAIILQKILQQLSNKEEFPILSTLILKSMQRAEYSTNNIGHFALELPYYTHFTSPIRRFPDLQVHTILKKCTSPDLEFFNFKEMEKELQEICKHSSFKERQADIAEEEAKKLKLIEYIKEHLGENFEGFITDITENIITVQTIKGITGLLDMSTLPNYKYNEKRRRLTRTNGQPLLKIGNHVRIKALNIDINESTIIFGFEENLSLPTKKELVKRIG